MLYVAVFLVGLAIFAHWITSNAAKLLKSSENPSTIVKFLSVNTDIRKVLLIIAHPDDEAMFFVPGIKAFQKGGLNVSLLCLTNGNAYGQGRLRETELRKSCAVLGISNVDVLDEEDSMTARWNIASVAGKIESYVNNRSIDVIMTFDKTGISGHVNHRDTCASVLAYFENAQLKDSSSPRHLLLLESPSLLLKYLGPASQVYEATLSFFERHSKYPLSSNWRLVAVLDRSSIWKDVFGAMQMHQSQLRWFRWLYICFASTVHTNTFLHFIKNKS